jgi:hypothetical protein
MAKFNVKFVHSISPSDKDLGPDVELPEGVTLDSKVLGKALRAAGVLIASGRIKSFRIEPGKVVVFPTKGSCLGPAPHLMSNWHAVVLTPAPVVVYTTAPADFDWGWTTDLGVAGHFKSRWSSPETQAKVVRKVSIPADKAEAQIDRYFSGAIYLTVRQADFDKFVADGSITP